MTIYKTVEDIDPDQNYNCGQLSCFVMQGGRRLDEAMRNDPCAPKCFRIKNKNAKFWKGSDLIEYVISADKNIDVTKYAALLAKEQIEKIKFEFHSRACILENEYTDSLNDFIEKTNLNLRDNLQKIASDVLERCSIDITNEGISGIYFLWKDDVVVYVGQSTNVYSRVKQHKCEKDFDKVTFIRLKNEKDILNDWEGLFINLIKPKLNGINCHGQIIAPRSTMFGEMLEIRI